MNRIIRDSIIRFCFLALLLLLGIISLFVFLFYKDLPVYIPFYNSMPWGLERLAQRHNVLMLPVAACVIAVVNILLCYFMFNRDQLIARILSINAMLCALFAFLAYLQILLLVF